MSDDQAERIEEDQRRQDQKYDDVQERQRQAETAELARQVRHDARALAALYGVDVDTAPYEDLLNERSKLMELVQDCDALEEPLRMHFWEYLLDLELRDEGANHEIQLFANSLLEDLDVKHPAAAPVLETLRDMIAAARRCF